MYGLSLICVFLSSLSTASASVEARFPQPNVFNCRGYSKNYDAYLFTSIDECRGSLSFVAHPADTLLYQNPDLFHDFYVFKCVTTVVFTSGDRGITGNFSSSLERGLEDAYAYMAGCVMTEDAWEQTNVRLNGKVLLLRTLKEAPKVQILYLRLPDGAPKGQGYKASDGKSLRKLFTNEIKLIPTIDGSATYTLGALKDMISSVLMQKSAHVIRVLDYRTPFPMENDDDCLDHADHSISARIVVDVVKREEVNGKLLGYAAGFLSKLDATLNATNFNFAIKTDTFLQYALHDKHICDGYDECLAIMQGASTRPSPDHDVRYATQAFDREYYVS